MSGFFQKFILNDKNALITGANGILGKKFSEALCDAGANVILVDIDANVKETAKQLEGKYGNKCMGIVCDISNPNEVQEMLLNAINEFEEINILHNNAAWKSSNLDDFFIPFEDFDIKTWRDVMDVNLDGMFLVAQAVAKQMIRQGKGGSIIQTSSIYGILGPDQRIYKGSRYLDKEINTPPVYSASKAGVIGLTKYLATYLGKYNIRVNSLTPGGVYSGQNQVFVNNYSNRVPLGRMACADEIVGALIFLASDASSYVTGQNIIVDGGLSAW